MTMNHDEEFELFELPRGGKISWAKLRELLPDIETALLFGTLKALPAQLPERIGAHWIDNGAAGQIKEAA